MEDEMVIARQRKGWSELNFWGVLILKEKEIL